MKKGYVIWFTGLSGSGKTTLATLLHQYCEKYNIKNQLLDGDDIRKFFNDRMGYNKNDRIDNLKRITFASKLLADNGIIVIVAAVASVGRVFLREKLDNYVQIFVNAPIEKVIERDTKGMYEKYKNGKASNIVGMDIPYYQPKKPDIIVHTDRENINESHLIIINHLRSLDIFD